jgi:arginase
MPAVDYRQGGGLDLSELSLVLQELLGTGRAVGITVTIYNPTLDPSGMVARNLIKSLVAGLQGTRSEAGR